MFGWLRSILSGVNPEDTTPRGLSISDSTEAPFPHCDANVLHAPGTCEYCDKYPGRQQERIRAGVNFTNTYDPDLMKCPATFYRSEETINKWGGNRPMTATERAAQDEYWAAVLNAYRVQE